MEECISVIIPVYNGAQQLPRCLDSVCAQTHAALEILLVDDGSTDGTAEVCARYARRDGRIRVIRQENQGPSGARNRGLEEAAGELVAFVDSDDWLEPDALACALAQLKQAQADVVLWCYCREYPSGSRPVQPLGAQGQIWRGGQTAQLFQRLLGPVGAQLCRPQEVDSLAAVWGKLYRRQAVDGVRFVDTRLIGTEDALFNLEVFRGIDCAVYLPQTFYHYEKGGADSFTHRYKPELVERWGELYRRMAALAAQAGGGAELEQALQNRIALGLIGLGLNLAEDDGMSWSEKGRALKGILALPRYRKALAQLPLGQLPVPWWVFFVLGRLRWRWSMLAMLQLMNLLRR